MKHSRIITEDLVNVVRDNIHTEARGMSLANDVHSSTLITHDLCVKKKKHWIQNEINVSSTAGHWYMYYQSKGEHIYKAYVGCGS